MGSGQSKYYRNSNNNQYPYPPPPQTLYPGQYNAPPYIPQYGPIPAYGPQMYPQQQGQGFIPPGVYGQGANLPAPILNWLPHDRRKSRRSKREREPRERERFVGGFAGDGPPPRQQEAPRRARSESRRREPPVQAPVIPPNSAPADAAHRVPTPFNPGFRGDEEDEDEDEDEDDRPRSGPSDHRRSASRQSARYSPPHSINGDFAHVMQPLEPANPVVFGPTGPRPAAPLSNPLPPPPRDIYEMSPYKALLNLPQTAALLTASYGPHMATVTPNALQQQQQPRPVERKKSLAKGLLRAFSKREKKEPQPQVHFVPVFVPAGQNQNQSNTQQSSAPQSIYPTPTAQQAADLVRSMSQKRPAFPHQPMPHPPGPMSGGGSQVRVSMMHSTHSADNMFAPVPPIPSSPPAVRFSQDSPYGVFMNHSPHRVLYNGVTYPTAAHLYEAMKFFDSRPDVVQKLLNCPTVQAAYDTSTQFDSYVRPDWALVYLDKMEEVLLLKFRQHPDLRMRLLATGDARIIYRDPVDRYWGVDELEQGENRLGKALVHVRDKLRAEGSGP